jgi:hypothetical protein
MSRTAPVSHDLLVLSTRLHQLHMRNVSTRNLRIFLQLLGRFQLATCQMRWDRAIARPRALSRKSRTAPSERRTARWHRLGRDLTGRPEPVEN